MKFTVLIPIYKNDKAIQLQECFDSIRTQTVLPDEVLLLVDGPVDDELKRVIIDSQFRAHFFPVNRGLPMVLNDGIKLAENPLIFRMDADDIAVRNRFELQLQYFRDHPETALLGGQIQEFLGSRNNMKGSRKVPEDALAIRAFARWRNPFNHPTVAFKKEVAEKLGGYDTKAMYFEDYDLWLRFLASNYEVRNLPDVLCFMRVNDAFISRRAGLRYIKHEYYFLKKARELGIISPYVFMLQLLTKLPLRMLPVSILKVLYKQILRKD